MRFQVILLPFLFLFFLSLSLTAQDPTVKGFCGTSRHDLDAISEQLSANLANLDHIAIERSGAVTYVPIRLFIVQRTDGTGGVELEKFLDVPREKEGQCICTVTTSSEVLFSKYGLFISLTLSFSLFHFFLSNTQTISYYRQWNFRFACTSWCGDCFRSQIQK